MKIKNIKVCAFDAYGTCFDINSAAQNLAKEIGKDWLGFSTTWRTVQLEYTWLRSLMKKHEDFWRVTEDSLDFAMESHKIDKKFRSKLLELYKKLNSYPELVMCLKHLKEKNVKTCILSNGSPSLLDELTVHAKVKELFDDLISIEDVGIYKPHPKVYELVTKKYNCKPEEVCFLSSNTWDIVGGGTFGYQSIWVDRFGKTFDKLGYQPKFKIKDLSELIKFF
ncbi:MAG: haloacid dehalogenase type II [Pelagibacteraceae bacterium]|jgi:2-haloacid dehalogenase|tara:strand:+ start:831 stop:1499 length:669 start_codon:yes stop_codon:yes gene_type:complete